MLFKELLKQEGQKAEGVNQKNPAQEAVHKALSCRYNLRTSRGRRPPEVPYFVVFQTKKQEKTTQPKQELIQHERWKQELRTEVYPTLVHHKSASEVEAVTIAEEDLQRGQAEDSVAGPSSMTHIWRLW